MNRIKIYWAGDLFDHKDLVGNLLLSKALTAQSDDRYEVILPQNSEANAARGLDIRDSDYKMLLECDVIVANFDGTDLDSGTVAEFCHAKFLDMPAVLLRTDFRNCGDRSTCPDPWNLMCSNFPRTKTITVNAMNELHRFFGQFSDPNQAIEAYHRGLARSIIAALDGCVAMPSVIGGSFETLKNQYGQILRTLGGKMEQLFPAEILDALIREKIDKGIYR